MRRRLPALTIGLCLTVSAWADTTTLTASPASKGTSIVPVSMEFSVMRAGDTGYLAVLNYHTADGTAIAGTDYTAASGSIVIPAGSVNATIPIILAADTGNTPSLTFQLQLDSAIGIGNAPAFAAAQNFAAGAEPYAVTTADINGDGKSDLIVANFGSNTVSVLLNTTVPGATTPSFATQKALATGTSPRSVTVADVNGDGKPDLIVANYGSNTVSVLLNTTAPGAATPSFATQKTFATGTNPVSVTVADLNGDGKPDLIVANYIGNTVSVLLNTTVPGATTPSFATQKTFATGTTPYSVTAADVNGDGKPDLIVANANDLTVSVLINTTAPGAVTPSFVTQQTFPTGASPLSVIAGDLNGDGKPDLILANPGDNTVSVLLNTTVPGATTPSFATPTTFATETSPYAVTLADVNGDGKPDLIVANDGDNTVSVLLNTTGPGAAVPTFAKQQTFATLGSPSAVTVTDINGDGKQDLITANFESSGTVSVLLNVTPSSGAVLNFGALQGFTTGAKPLSVAVADVNGDGKPDLIVANDNDNTVSVLLNTTAPGAVTPSFAMQQTFTTGIGPASVTVADVNGDGKPDLIIANNGTNSTPGNTVSVLLNTTAPGASLPSFAVQKTFVTGAGPYSVTTADLNGDGKPDLIVTNFAAGTVSVLRNTTAPGAGVPSFAAQQVFVAAPATGADAGAVAAADLNGDGKPDLIVTNPGSGTISVLLNTTAPGATTISFATHHSFSAFISYSVAIADVNGDGRPDVIVTSNGNLVAVLLNTTAPGATTPSFAAAQSFTVGSNPASVTASDVDGDGRPDLIVANEGTLSTAGNTISVLLNTTALGATTPSFAVQQTFAAGLYPISVSTADVNGDGQPDVIVAGGPLFSSTDTVSVVLSTQYQALTAGSPATGTIVHDYIFADGFE